MAIAVVRSILLTPAVTQGILFIGALVFYP